METKAFKARAMDFIIATIDYFPIWYQATSSKSFRSVAHFIFILQWVSLVPSFYRRGLVNWPEVTCLVSGRVQV